MLLRSGIIVAFFTLLSRFFGLARELFIAATFGTTPIADCVNVAFKFPNLFRRIFAEGALASVFIPMFSEKLVTSKEAATRFSGKIFILLLLVLIVLTISMQITMPYLMVIIAPGFFGQGDKYELAVTLCRITIPYMIFVSIAALFGGMMNSIRKFAAFAFVPIIMNICIIFITPMLAAKYTAHFSIAYALVIAGILQVVFMYICLSVAGLNFPLLFRPKDQEVIGLIKNMGPATLSSSTQQLGMFISQSIASFLPGAVSILSYADRLYQLPLALIGITFGTILLPELSRIYKQKNYEAANNLQNKAIIIALTISVPAMCGLFVLSTPIIHLIYERGHFTHSDTILTADVLMTFSLGLPAFVLTRILLPIFYANLDTKTPFKITMYSLLLNTVLDIVLMFLLGPAGIALGSSIAAWFNVWLLNKYAKSYGDFKMTYQTKIFSLKVIFSSFMMSIFAFISNYYLGHLFYSSNFAIKSASLLGTIAFSIIVFALFAYFLKIHKILFSKL